MKPRLTRGSSLAWALIALGSTSLPSVTFAQGLGGVTDRANQRTDDAESGRTLGATDRILGRDDGQTATTVAASSGNADAGGTALASFGRRRASAGSAGSSEQLSICSFNIQFLGMFKARDDQGLAEIVKHHDIVVVQELVAPPSGGTFPNGNPFKPDQEAKRFFDAMEQRGFAYVLSEEDTGTNDAIHKNTSSTEWFVTFYKADRVTPANDLPNGFLAEDRSNHPDYERVPYAFPFRTTAGNDFVLISVHLQPGKGEAERRAHELKSIARWIDEHDEVEGDFIILGDMNLEPGEHSEFTPPGYLSLNDEDRPTNTNLNGLKPYDHVMFNPSRTPEVDRQFDMQVVDLIQVMRPFWQRVELSNGEVMSFAEAEAFVAERIEVTWEEGMDPRHAKKKMRAALKALNMKGQEGRLLKELATKWLDGYGKATYPGQPYEHDRFRIRYSDHQPVVFRYAITSDDD